MSPVTDAEALIRQNHELLAEADAARQFSRGATRKTQVARQLSERLILQAQIAWIGYCLRHRTAAEWRLAVAKWVLGTGRRPSPAVWQAAAIASRASERAKARWRRAAMSVPGAFGMNADQLWKCARVLRAMTPPAQNVEQSAELEARADRAEGLAWDKALRHRVSRGDLA
jgi:hypothetical protein